MTSPRAVSSPAPSVSPPWRRLHWAMVVVWAAFIFYLSSAGFGPSFTEWLLIHILALLHATVSPHTFDVLHLCLRKLAHLTEYGIFSMLIYAGFLGERDFQWRPRLALRSIVIAGLYSLTDEYHQSFVASRTPSLLDSGIDAVGATLGTLIIWGWDRLRLTASYRKSGTAAPARETNSA